MRLNTAVILFILFFLCLFCGKNDQVASADKDVPGEPTEKQMSTAVVEVINGENGEFSVTGFTSSKKIMRCVCTNTALSDIVIEKLSGVIEIYSFDFDERL